MANRYYQTTDKEEEEQAEMWVPDQTLVLWKDGSRPQIARAYVLNHIKGTAWNVWFGRGSLGGGDLESFTLINFT